MRAYRQTFRQYWILLIAPVIIAAAIGGFFTFRAPPVYRSTASLWVDNGASISSSLANAMSASSLSDPLAEETQNATDPTQINAPAGPAPLEAEVVSELLLTSGFDLAVEHGTGPRGSEVALSPAEVTAVATGPQVLELSYDGPSPASSRAVLRSLIKQLGAAGSEFGEGIGKTASTLDRQTLSAAKSVLAGNQGALTAFAHSHPWANATNNATYRELAAEVQLAHSQLVSDQAASGEANVEAADNSGNATLELIDAPSVPATPAAGMSAKVSGFVSGAFAGLVLSLLALIVFTPRPPIRWDAEVPLFARLASWDRRGRRRASSARSAAARSQGARPQMHLHREGG